jgi:hypothetical protein
MGLYGELRWFAWAHKEASDDDDGDERGDRAHV